MGKTLIEYLFKEGELVTEMEWEINICTIPVFSNFESFSVITSSCLINRWKVDVMGSTVILKVGVPSIPAVWANITKDWKSGEE